MITINAFLFWVILSAVFIAGFLTCSLFCINDLKPRLTQTPEEAAKDESHSATRYEEPDK
jgi:hypothetical protein